MSRIVIRARGEVRRDFGVDGVFARHGARREAVFGARERREPEPAALDEHVVPPGRDRRAGPIQLDRIAREGMDLGSANGEAPHRACDEAVRVRAACRSGSDNDG